MADDEYKVVDEAHNVVGARRVVQRARSIYVYAVLNKDNGIRVRISKKEILAHLKHIPDEAEMSAFMYDDGTCYVN